MVQFCTGGSERIIGALRADITEAGRGWYVMTGDAMAVQLKQELPVG